MRYDEFVNKICNVLEEKLGEDYAIQLHEIVKVNDVVLRGVMINDKEEPKRIVPVIYLERYYEMYKEKANLEECADSIIDFYRAAIDRDISTVVDNLFEWEDVKTKIIPVVVSKENNEQLLEGLVYREYLDLAIYYVIKVDEIREESAIAAVKVSKNILKTWHVSEDDIHTQALANMREDGYKIKNMMTVMKELMFDNKIDLPADVVNSGDTGMYVLSNRSQHYGAAGILYDEVLEQFAEQCDNSFYILPSSLHELILLPYEEDIKVEDLNRMVREINANEVERSEVLQNHVYYYDREKEKTVVCM